jgi:GTPase SAR1 family protein
VGKTSLARRFAQGKFDENQFATVGGSSTPEHFVFGEEACRR